MKKDKKFLAQSDYRPSLKAGSVKKQEGQSLTVPNQAISVKKLAHDYETSGVINATMYKSGSFPDWDEIEQHPAMDANAVDITDYEAKAKAASRILDKVNKFNKDLENEKQKKKLDDAVEARVKEELEKQKEKNFSSKQPDLGQDSARPS